MPISMRGFGWGGAVPPLARLAGKARHSSAAAQTEKWTSGILGNSEPNGAILGLVPVPGLDLPPREKPAAGR